MQRRGSVYLNSEVQHKGFDGIKVNLQNEQISTACSVSGDFVH